jgi:tetratricopeptide (TPR) repeat protein
MIPQAAEESFRKGRDLLAQGRARDSMAFFRSAIDFDEKANGECEQARYLSYYGLCLCMTRQDLRGALGLCRKATRKDSAHPQLWWNLARVALSLGKRGEAYRALQCGSSIQSDHDGINHDLARMGVRRPPVLVFLPREHRLNILLGKFRVALRMPIGSLGASRKIKQRPKARPVSDLRDQMSGV